MRVAEEDVLVEGADVPIDEDFAEDREPPLTVPFGVAGPRARKEATPTGAPSSYDAAHAHPFVGETGLVPRRNWLLPAALALGAALLGGALYLSRGASDEAPRPVEPKVLLPPISLPRSTPLASTSTPALVKPKIEPVVEPAKPERSPSKSSAHKRAAAPKRDKGPFMLGKGLAVHQLRARRSHRPWARL